MVLNQPTEQRGVLLSLSDRWGFVAARKKSGTVGFVVQVGQVNTLSSLKQC
jgi:hypothetical protein